MGVAALISWLVTALFGLYLLAVWLIENDVTGRGAAASWLPAPVIVGHVLLALSGLVFWVIHLLSGSEAAGWAAGGDPGGCRHAWPDHVYPVDPGAPCLRGGRSQGGPAGRVRLPGRTGLPGVGGGRSRPARRHDLHPGPGHHAGGLIGHRPGTARAGPPGHLAVNPTFLEA